MPVNVTTIYDADDNEVELPTKWAICGTCRGNGQHSLRLGAITQEDREQWSDDEFEDYMAGAYDEACDPCGGSGKIKVVDQDQLTPEQRQAWQDATRAEEEYQAEVRAEQRYFYGLEAY